MTLLHVLIIICVSIRIIKVRLPVAVSLAWLLLVFFLPLVGAIAYLVLGEKRLGRQFAARTQAITARYDSWLKDLPPEIRSDPRRLGPEGRTISRLAETHVRIPALTGNRLEGPVVLALTALFRWDWEVETGSGLNRYEEGDPAAARLAGETDVQVIPSGPGSTGNSIYQLLLISIYSARR